MAYVDIVTALALLQFVVFGFKVGKARGRHYWSPAVAAVLGVIYLIGREVYAATYVKDPAKRDVGFGMTFLSTVILILGGLSGAVWSFFGK